MKPRSWISFLALALLFGGCDSSDPGRTEFVLNPQALTFTQITTNTGADTSPAWHPTGERLAFISPRSGQPEVWTLQLSNLGLWKITEREMRWIVRPAWSADGDSLVIAADFVGGKSPTSGPGLWVVSYLFTHPIYRLVAAGDLRNAWPAWSPDGARILYSSGDALLMIPPGGGRVETLDTGGLTGEFLEPAWSPDGTRVAFVIYDGEDYDIYQQTVDGGNLTSLVATDANERSPTWSSGGRYIAFQSDAAGRWDIWLQDLGDGTRLNLTPGGSSDETQPAWDPAGGSIAFCSDRSGNEDIWFIEGIPAEY